ncbi:STAS domain-containing protein [Planctomycetota bacterium]
MKPNISIQYNEDITIVTFTDEQILEDKDIRALEDSILSVVEQGGPIKLILDFCNVKFLSSMVLGLLIRISKRVYENEGKLALCNISDKIYEIFKITRLTNIFDIFEDVEDATDELNKSG